MTVNLRSLRKSAPAPKILSIRSRQLLLNVFAILIGAMVGAVQGQDSKFSFDTAGNLIVETPAILGLPQIIAQPQTQVVKPGELASFSVVAKDIRGLTYQWRFNGTNVSGTTSDALLLTNVSQANEGLYSVVLSNSSGSVTSAPAMLWIDSDGDGLPDSWEQSNFGGLAQNPGNDFDGDGVANLDEFMDGTSPTNSASAQFRLTVMSDGGQVAVTPTKLSYTNGELVTISVTAFPGETFHIWSGSVITRTNPVTLVMTTNKTLFAHFNPFTFSWTNSAGGDWHNALNWNSHLVPSALDDVGPLPAVTITINAFAECHDLTLAGCTLTGTGDLSILGDAVWSGGTMGGSGRTIIAPGATFTISSAGFNLSLERSLENGGTVVWAGNPTLNLANGVITNRVGALFHVQNATTLGSGVGAPRFDNAGTFRKSSNAGTALFQIPFNNYGTVDVQSGTLQCGANFLNNGAVTAAAGTTYRMTAGGSGSGTFTNPPTALVEWSGGTFTLNSGAQLNGSGLYKISGGGFICNPDVAVANLDLNATLDGPGIVTVNNLMNWTGGTMSGSGRTVIAPGATMNMASPFFTMALTGRTVENGGTFLWSTAAGLNVNGAVITNRAGALFDAQNAGTLTFSGGSPRFDNVGTFRKSASSGTTTVSIPFNNFGTMDIQTGTLLNSGSFLNNGTVALAGGTTHRLSAGGSGSGTFTNPATALVEWTTSFTLNSGAQLSGSGLYKISGGGFICNPDVAVANLDLNATLDGPGIVTVNNLMNWTGGTMSGSGRTVVAPGATMNMASPFFTMALTGRTVENGGTFLWTTPAGLTVNGAFITNRPGALFDAQNSGTLNFGGGSPRFDNAGTLRKSGNNGTTAFGIPFNNYGTVDLRIGTLSVNGGWTCSSNSILNCALGGTAAGSGYGQLQKSGTIALNGALSVDFLPGFTPATNDAFTVVTAGTRSGSFSSFSYPANRVTMVMTNTPTAVILNTTAVLPVPQPMFLAAQLENPNVRLIWTATSNVTYRLEYNGNVGSTNWTALAGDITTISNTASKLDASTVSNRFYRVRVLP